MKPRPPPTNCARSPKCGDADERDLHSLAAGTETLCALEGADRGFAGPTAALPAGTGLRPGASVSKGGQWKLPAICGSGRDQHVDTFYRDLFRNRHAVGPPVRLSERNAGGAGSAD